MKAKNNNPIPKLAFFAIDDGAMEAGCDEVGRGCLAGDLFAAAVILDPKKTIHGLNDSKKLSPLQREELRKEIELHSLAFAIGIASHHEVDTLNVLQASILAMHRAIEALPILPQRLLIDGNRFKPYKDIPYQCIVKGDSLLQAIAAASILAKTYRDQYMCQMDKLYPQYLWKKNKGYPTKEHIEAVRKYGFSPIHRKTFAKHLFTPSLFPTEEL